MKAGPDFGDNQGKYYVVSRALYGLKSVRASFRSFLAKKLDELNFKSCIADPDVWRRPATKEDGSEYYEYVLTYVDDLIAVSQDAKRVLQDISRDIKLKNYKIEPPGNYLGAKLCTKTIAELRDGSYQAKTMSTQPSKMSKKLQRRDQNTH